VEDFDFGFVMEDFPFFSTPLTCVPFPALFFQNRISSARSAAFASALFRLAVFDCQSTSKILPKLTPLLRSFMEVCVLMQIGWKPSIHQLSRVNLEFFRELPY